MKSTSYFKFRMQQPDRSWIKPSWIKQTIENPLRCEVQSDGRMRLWSKVEEADARVLRVILLEDGETVHHAFFDRDFKE